MSLIPIYIHEKDGQLPQEGNYFVFARNGVFLHNDAGVVKGLVKVDRDQVPMLQDLEETTRSLPVFVYDDKNLELPTDTSYYVIAKNGVFYHRPNAAKRFLKVDLEDMKHLGNLTTRVQLKLPPLPTEVIYQSLMFFRRVWYHYQAEACVVLFYNPAEKKYFVRCPKQSVSGGGVNYGTKKNGMWDAGDPEEIAFTSNMWKKGYAKVGTIHSHCNFSAFHSGTDTNDEAKFDGIHITIGHVDQKSFSLVSSLVVNDNRFQVEPEKVISGLKFSRSGGQASFYDVDYSEDERELLAMKHKEQLEQDWLPQVRIKDYSSNNGSEKETEPKNSLFGPSPTQEIRHAPSKAPDKKLVLPPIDQKYEAAQGKEAQEATPEQFLQKVRDDASSLRYWRTQLSGSRIESCYNTLRHFFKRNYVDDIDIAMASQIDPQNIQFYDRKGYAIR